MICAHPERSHFFPVTRLFAFLTSLAATTVMPAPHMIDWRHHLSQYRFFVTKLLFVNTHTGSLTQSGLSLWQDDENFFNYPPVNKAYILVVTELPDYFQFQNYLFA